MSLREVLQLTYEFLVPEAPVAYRFIQLNKFISMKSLVKWRCFNIHGEYVHNLVICLSSDTEKSRSPWLIDLYYFYVIYTWSQQTGTQCPVQCPHILSGRRFFCEQCSAFFFSQYYKIRENWEISLTEKPTRTHTHPTRTHKNTAGTLST
jgi:hypothetical protein